MMGFMIYFVINMRFFNIFKVFLKSGPSLKKSGKIRKNVGDAWRRIPIYTLLRFKCYICDQIRRESDTNWCISSDIS